MAISTELDFSIPDEGLDTDELVAARVLPSTCITFSGSEIADDASIGDPVGTLAIIAAYQGTPFWQLIDDANGCFSVNSSTGVVTVTKALTAGDVTIKVRARGIRPNIFAPTFPITIVTGGGGGGYTQSFIRFDGSASLPRGDNLTGATNSPVGAFVTWINPLALASTIGLFTNFDVYVLLKITSVGNIRFEFFNGDGDAFFTGDTANGVVIPNERNCILLAWDTNYAAGSRRLAIYQVSAAGVETLIPYVIDDDVGIALNIFYNSGNCQVLANNSAHPIYNASDTGMWIGAAAIVEADNTISEVNLRKFISASGQPVNPTSWPADPVIGLTGLAATYPDNTLGSGGPFTVTGGSISDVP